MLMFGKGVAHFGCFMLFFRIFSSIFPTTSTYTTNSSKKNVIKSWNFFESFEQKAGENRTWTYVNKPKEYRVIADDNQVVINSIINGKKREVTLVAENALKVQNLLQKMNFSVKPIRPIKPIMPIKPIAPILLSFEDPKENQREIDQYSRELKSYERECRKEMADYQSELASYEKEVASHTVNATEHETVRKDLINLVELFINPS